MCTSDYPRLAQLGIPVHHGEHVACVWPEDISAALDGDYMSMRTFDGLFGAGQTTAIIDGKHALYPWDVERTLRRMCEEPPHDEAGACMVQGEGE